VLLTNIVKYSGILWTVLRYFVLVCCRCFMVLSVGSRSFSELLCVVKSVQCDLLLIRHLWEALYRWIWLVCCVSLTAMYGVGFFFGSSIALGSCDLTRFCIFYLVESRLQLFLMACRFVRLSCARCWGGCTQCSQMALPPNRFLAGWAPAFSYFYFLLRLVNVPTSCTWVSFTSWLLLITVCHIGATSVGPSVLIHNHILACYYYFGDVTPLDAFLCCC